MYQKKIVYVPPLVKSCINNMLQWGEKKQAVRITIGLLLMMWFDSNEKYCNDIKLNEWIDVKQNNKKAFQNRLIEFEKANMEWQGVLTGLFSGANDEGCILECRNNIDDFRKNFYQNKERIEQIIEALIVTYRHLWGGYQRDDSIYELIVQLIQIYDAKTCYDLTTDFGDLLIYFQNNQRLNIELNGNEAKDDQYLLTQMRLFMKEMPNNMLSNDQLLYEKPKNNKTYDVVIANAISKGYSTGSIDGSNQQFKYAQPSKHNTEWAYGQIALKFANNQGRVFMLGTGAMTSRKSDSNTRKALIKEDYIEAVVHLTNKQYEQNTKATDLIIINKDKRENLKGKILFIDVSEFQKKNPQSENQIILSDIDIKQIVAFYQKEENILGKTCIVDNEEVIKHEASLNVNEYIKLKELKSELQETVALIDVATIIRGLNNAKNSVFSEEKFLCIGYKTIEDGRIIWESATKEIPRVPNVERYMIKPMDVIVTTKGARIKVAVVDEDCPPNTYINETLTIIRVDPKQYNAYVLYQFLTSKVGIQMLQSLQTGRTVRIINNKNMSKLVLPKFKKDQMKQLSEAIMTAKVKYDETIASAISEYQLSCEEINQSFN